MPILSTLASLCIRNHPGSMWYDFLLDVPIGVEFLLGSGAPPLILMAKELRLPELSTFERHRECALDLRRGAHEREQHAQLAVAAARPMIVEIRSRCNDENKN